MVSMLKLHMQTMLLSTSFNLLEIVLSNLYHGFTYIAERCLHYMNSLGRQPSSQLVISKYLQSGDFEMHGETAGTMSGAVANL